MDEPQLQVSHCRFIVSAKPDRANNFGPEESEGLPAVTRRLLPILYARFCRSPIPPPAKLMVFDTPDGRADLYKIVASDARKSEDDDIRRAGRRWRRRSLLRRDVLSFRALNAIGSIYAWVLHRLLREDRDKDLTATSTLRWRPTWPIDLTNIDGMTVLHLAVQFHRRELVAHLIRHGADLSIRDHLGRSALHWAAVDLQQQNTLPMVQLLLEAGADPNARDQVGRTPLHYAVARDYPQIVQFLLNHGADPKRFDREGLRPRDLVSAFKRTAANVEIADMLDAREHEEKLASELATAPARMRPRI